MKNLLLTLSALLLIGCTPNAGLSPQSQIAKTTVGSKNAILKLDTGGHTGRIEDVIITKEQDIITASNDGTIRVWNKNGQEKRKILGQIEVGYGDIYAIALSPDEKYLAVGVYISKQKKLEAGAIRLYDYETGKLSKILKSHKSVINDLSFSEDGKYLISSSADESAKIWNMQTFSLFDTIHHSKSTYGVKIIKKNNEYYAITTGLDNKITLYSFKDKKVIKEDKKPHKLAFLSVNQNHIAVYGEGSNIYIYDFNLKQIGQIQSKTKPSGLNYSPNGKHLIVGSSQYPPSVNIYDVENNYKNKINFKNHSNLVLAVNFLDNDTAISTGGDNFEIYIWNINSGKEIKKIEGNGDTVWEVGINKQNIMWSTVLKSKNNLERIKKTKGINLETMKGIKKNIKFKEIPIQKNDYSLSTTKGGSLKIKDGFLILARKNKVITRILSHLGHNCYGFYKNMIISGASNGHLKIHNFQGEEIANLVGHTGEIWSIALDGDRLVSGGSDQIIRVWDLSKLKLNNEKKVDYDYLKTEQRLAEETTGKKWTIQNIMDHHNKRGANYYIINKLYPQLNLFITKKEDWIAWTPEGFYNASKGAEKYIGYHINQGANKEAEFLDISRFKKQFYRPDLIQKAIAGEDLSSYAKDIDIDSLLKAGLPPKVKILNSAGDIADNELKIVVDVCDQGGGHENLQFYVDKTPIKYLKQTKNFGAGANANCTVFTQVLLLPSGKHKIGVDATNKEGNIISNTSSILINNTKKVEGKPNLHVLTLSIADYKDDKLDLTYPNNDADKMVSKFQSIGEVVFGKVYPYSLKDSQVTKEQIASKVAEISKDIGVNDVFVLYISGHGVTNNGVGGDGDYYFIPYDCPQGADVRKHAISQSTLTDIIAQTKTIKSVILLDTCESGSMAKQQSIRSSMQRFGDNVGRAIISGATEKQSAIDGYKEHGIFTYTLLDAMGDKDLYFRKRLNVGDIAKYVKQFLPELAKEAFNHAQKPIIYLHGDTTFDIGGLGDD